MTGRALVLAVAALTSLSGATRLVDAAARPHATRHRMSLAGECFVSTAYARAFRAAARETGFPVALLVAVAWEESRMNPRARSGAGARGLFQLMPQTARELGTSPDDPRASIRAGARYLSQLLKRFGGNLDLALAAYNAGPSAVDRSGGAPSGETMTYVANVTAAWRSLRGCT